MLYMIDLNMINPNQALGLSAAGSAGSEKLSSHVPWLAGALAGWSPGWLEPWLAGVLAGWSPGWLEPRLEPWLAGALAGIGQLGSA
jgi:hypothetical protein